MKRCKGCKRELTGRQRDWCHERHACEKWRARHPNGEIRPIVGEAPQGTKTLEAVQARIEENLQAVWCLRALGVLADADDEAKRRRSIAALEGQTQDDEPHPKRRKRGEIYDLWAEWRIAKARVDFGSPTFRKPPTKSIFEQHRPPIDGELKVSSRGALGVAA